MYFSNPVEINILLFLFTNAFGLSSNIIIKEIFLSIPLVLVIKLSISFIYISVS